MKSKLYSLILLASFLLPVLIMAVAIHSERCKIQQQVKAIFENGIADSELEKLCFHKRQAKKILKWEHAAEFEYQNKMYDVVRSEVFGDSVIYFCYADNKETKLNQDLQNLVAYTFGHHNKQQQQEQQLIDFFKTLYCPQPHDVQAFTASVNPSLFFIKNYFLIHRTFAPDSPPPWWSV